MHSKLLRVIAGAGMLLAAGLPVAATIASVRP